MRGSPDALDPLRLYHTLRHLRPIQLVARAWFVLARPRPDLRPAPARRQLVAPLQDAPEPAPSLLGPARFRLLGEELDIARPQDWRDPRRPMLTLYHLHYFEDLGAQRAGERADWHRALIERWIADNPPATAPGWDPYPTSLRLVSWIKWALRGNALSDPAVHSLAVQARHLRRRVEYHLLGNHLIANATGLVFAGLFFAGDEPDRWLALGERLLARQLDEQILPDGGHFERSPMYHALMLNDLLDVVNVRAASGRGVPSGWPALIANMLRWLRVMTHPDGQPALFNDAAFGIAPSLAELEAYARRLGIEASQVSSAPLVSLERSGYARLDLPRATMLVDIAPIGPDYMPGHGHADTFTFELSIDGRRLIVDTGTSRYGTGPERHRQRSTASHNTVTVDDHDSSEVWHGFRVARRARVFEQRLDRDRLEVEARHDGYCRLDGRPIHRRLWRADAGSIRIDDEVTGGGEHDIAIRLLFHPAVRVEPDGASTFSATVAGSQARVTIHVAGVASVELEPATYHPEFGVSQATSRLVARVRSRLPVKLSTTIEWE